jgi:glycosyltransferase involved in cell wall biosynthesis
MALSKPVIATRAGGVPEIVEDGVTGLLYTPGSSVELAQFIEQLLASGDRRVALGTAAFGRVMSEFNIEANTARTYELYRRVLAGPV